MYAFDLLRRLAVRTTPPFVTIDRPHGAKAAIILAVSALLFGCSDVKTDTFEVELTTDAEPHVVELWYHPDTMSNERAPLYRLRFPQAYYLYRDNHYALKQTTVGLLLERRLLQPLTQVMRSETGLNEPLSIPNYREGPLKKLGDMRYRDRKLLIRIVGSDGGLTLGHPSREDLLKIGQNYRHENGFAIVDKRYPPTAQDPLPSLIGYSLADPLIGMSCLSSSSCSFAIDYRKSRVSFALPRSQMPDAHEIARKIIRLLDQHLVS